MSIIVLKCNSACCSSTRKKRDAFFCYYTNIMAQRSSHLWTGITFNILNVNVSLQQLHIVTHLCRICTFYLACPAWKISRPAVHESIVHLFLVFLERQKMLNIIAFRCWDHIFWCFNEQSVEIYFFPQGINQHCQKIIVLVVVALFISDITHLYNSYMLLIIYLSFHWCFWYCYCCCPSSISIINSWMDQKLNHLMDFWLSSFRSLGFPTPAGRQHDFISPIIITIHVFTWLYVYFYSWVIQLISFLDVYRDLELVMAKDNIQKLWKYNVFFLQTELF